MMLAYNNGDIVAEIKNSILSNSSAREKFTALVDFNVDRSDCLELMTYILDRYANMRGTFLFVTLRGMLVETMQSSGPRSRQPDQK